jgi:hypothetical protein
MVLPRCLIRSAREGICIVLRLAQVGGQRFDQIQQQANAFAGTLILDACYIDMTKYPINRADSGLATHPVNRKTTGAICPAKSNKNNQKW